MLDNEDLTYSLDSPRPNFLAALVLFGPVFKKNVFLNLVPDFMKL